MWLLPLFRPVASLASRTFYRLHVRGGTVPRSGPVLLVANHPNSLLDPFLVIVAVKRPVRFLAKSPLFSDHMTGWIVRAVGAIPVYRPRDNPSETRRNQESFRAVFSALAEGAAVGIFPEGMSHDEPSLVPLRTGAARIALGAAAHSSGPFPVIPIGLVFEAKEEFRARAYAVVGEHIEWADLASSGAGDSAAVRELTARIERGLHTVTINFERWEDAPLVAAASAIYRAELGRDAGSADQLAVRMAAARALSRLHLEGDPEASSLATAVRRHTRALELLGLSPAELHLRSDTASALRWTARRLSLRSLLTGFVALAGTVLFWVPYRATGSIVRRSARDRGSIAMHKLLYGIGVFMAWIIALVLLTGLFAGWQAALIALILLPALALATVSYAERWTGALRDVRNFFVRRWRPRALAALRERQRALAMRLAALYESTQAPPIAAPGG
jgi:glycerol-3-phosphate O-acyltransferase/dihydroxyacetone phosphate acyltransferase